MSVAAVVIAFHRPESLRVLLADLAGIDVVVVNIDNDAAVAAVANDAGAAVVAVAGNPGYAAGVNRGAAATDADVVVFMNDDLRMSAAALRALADTVAAGGADVALPALLADGAPERTIAALPTPARLAIEWAVLPDRPLFSLGRVEKWRTPTGPEQVDAAAATVVAVRAELLRDEPLPETYFLYWEESEWFWRLRDRGARVVYRPDVVVEHRGGRGDIRPEKSALLARNAVLCVRRTQGRVAAALAVPVVVLWNLRLFVTALARRRHVRARWAGLRAALGSWSVVA